MSQDYKPKNTTVKPKAKAPKKKISVAWRDAARAIIGNKQDTKAAIDKALGK